MKIKIFLVTLISVLIFCAVGSVRAQSSDNSASIAQIQQEIAQLTQELNQMLAQQQGTAAWCYTFDANLGWTNSGTIDVVNLHTALQQQGISYAPDDISTYNIGTSNAVIQFQKNYGIWPQSGYVGTKTRAKLNQLYGCSSQNVNPNTSACSPNWTCGWGPCTNGYQSQVAVDSNNCGLPSSQASIACPTLAQQCTQNSTQNDYCAQLNSDIMSAYNTGCSDLSYSSVADVNKDGYVNGADLNNWLSNSSNQSWCQQELNDTTNPCTTNPTLNCNTWNCTNWSACSNSQKTRTCVLLAGCTTSANPEPAVTDGCSSVCIPDCSNSTCGGSDGCGGICQTGSCQTGKTCSNGQCVCSNYISVNWNCGQWGLCLNGYQTRTCTLPSGDCNQAATAEPSETQTCTSTSSATNSCWSCSDWGPCVVGYQSRTCSLKLGSICANTPLSSKPAGDQKCSSTTTTPPATTCTSNWSCTNWSACGTNSQQTRNCTDTNNCSTPTGNPVLTQSCNNGLPTVDIKISRSTPGTMVDARGNAVVHPVEVQNCSTADSCTPAKINATCSGLPCGAADGCGGNCQTGLCTVGDNTCLNGQCGRWTYLAGSPYTPTVFSCTSLSACTNGQQTRTCTTPAYNFSTDDTDGPVTGTAGYSMGIKWNSTNVTSCTASGSWSGTKYTSGLESTGNLSANGSSPKTYTYNISCTGPNGTATDSAIINVSPPLTTTITASPSIVNVGDSTKITWSSTGATICCVGNGDTSPSISSSTTGTSCVPSGTWTGQKATSGSETIIPAASAPATWGGELDQNYTIICQGPLGVSQDSFIVQVRAYDLQFSANPNSVKDGGSTTLTWSSTGATSCNAMSGDWSGNLATSGSQTVGPLSSSNSPYGFWISCTGPLGENRETVSVQVQSSQSSLLDDIQKQLASVEQAVDNFFAK